MYYYYQFALKTLESGCFCISKLKIMHSSMSQKHMTLEILATSNHFFCLGSMYGTFIHPVPYTQIHSHFHMNIFMACIAVWPSRMLQYAYVLVQFSKAGLF